MTTTKFDPDRIDPTKPFYITVAETNADGTLEINAIEPNAYPTLAMAVEGAQGEAGPYDCGIVIYVFHVYPVRRVTKPKQTTVEDLTVNTADTWTDAFMAYNKSRNQATPKRDV